VAAAALGMGQEVTCLARGESGDAPAGRTFVSADRDLAGAYDPVRHRHWDLVVDVSWQPGQVRSAVEALGDVAAHWVYVSSCSVYADQSTPRTDESAALLEPLPAGTVRVDREQYGAAKVSCERLCADRLGDRVLLARAGLIAGYGDLSDRFGYWPGRFALAMRHGGAVLVPAGFRAAPAQAIDVADLAHWLVRSGLAGVSGALNAVGPHWTFGEVLDVARAVTGFAGPLVEAPPDWLREQHVEEYMGARSLPLWFVDPSYAGFSDRARDAASAAGLPHSDLERVVRECLRWELELGLDRERRAGLTRSEELALLAALKAA
jgi:2'-hydroxyisoflavone reductase